MGIKNLLLDLWEGLGEFELIPAEDGSTRIARALWGFPSAPMLIFN